MSILITNISSTVFLFTNSYIVSCPQLSCQLLARHFISCFQGVINLQDGIHVIGFMIPIGYMYGESSSQPLLKGNIISFTPRAFPCWVCGDMLDIHNNVFSSGQELLLLEFKTPQPGPKALKPHDNHDVM